ncbi:MAG: hypothetical protein ACJAVW_001780, partial [Spirosomataceae bacterium]
DAAVVNSCYELSAGSVKTAYDPTWSNILDVDAVVCDFKSLANEANLLLLEIVDDSQLLDCEESSIQKFRNYISKIENVSNKIDNSCDLEFYEKKRLTDRLEALKNSCICLLNTKCPSSSSARVAQSSSARVSQTNQECDADVSQVASDLQNEIDELKGNKEKTERVVWKDPNGNPHLYNFSYFASHNNKVRSYFNSISSSLNGAPLGMQEGGKTFIWNQVAGEYLEVTGYDASSSPIWSTNPAPLKPATEYSYYRKYFYETDLDCYTQKYDLEDNKVGEITRYPGCVLYEGDADGPKVRDIDYDELPETISVASLIGNRFHLGSNFTCLLGLELNDRIRLLEELSATEDFINDCVNIYQNDPDFNVGNCYESLFRNLIISTPQGQQRAVLNAIKEKKIYVRIFNSLQFNTLDVVLKEIAGMITKEFQPTLEYHEYGTISNITGDDYFLDYENSKILTYRNGVGVNIDNNGTITFTTTRIKYYENAGTVLYTSRQLFDDPYEYVWVHFEEAIPGTKYTENSNFLMPVYQAVFFFNERHREEVIATSKVALEVATFAIGAGEISAAIRVWRASRSLYSAFLVGKAVTDIGVGVVDIVVSNTLAKEWEQTIEGRKLLEKYNRIMLGLTVGTLSVDVYNLAFSRRGISGIIDENTDINKVKNAVDEVLAISDDFYLFLTNSYPKLAKKYKDLSEDARLLFRSDFSNNANILADFNSGSIKVSIWDELTTLNRVGLSKNETALKFLSQIDGTEAAIALKRKLLLVLDDPKLLQFITDFGSDFRKLAIFEGNTELIDSWKFLDDAGVDDAIRKNIDAITDPDAALDAIQASGKAKPTWPEIQALFKRGNDYNTKARAIYGDDFVEVVLKGVDGKAGKRLDTYIPPSNGKAGEIISRKATTLSEIQPNTFKNYLNELITKYPKGAELNSSKFPSGTTLDGDYFLEIPTSNKSFFESSTEFQKVLSDFNTAKGVDVKIKYLVE